jgi:hypothetical protein
MSNLLILVPAAIAAITASRGSDVSALLTADPRDAWADSAVNSPATIDIDFGGVITIDTVFLGYLTGAAAGATWSITGGAAGYTSVTLQSAATLRVPDANGRFSAVSHALWHGAAVSLRYLRITLTQPSGNPALSAGVVLGGNAFQAQFSHEWGAGRRVIDSAPRRLSRREDSRSSRAHERAHFPGPLAIWHRTRSRSFTPWRLRAARHVPFSLWKTRIALRHCGTAFIMVCLTASARTIAAIRAARAGSLPSPTGFSLSR